MMKRIALPALLALSASLAQGQSIDLNHYAEALYRKSGDNWWGSSQTGDAPSYDVIYGVSDERYSRSLVSGEATFGRMSGRGTVMAFTAGGDQASAMAWLDDSSVYDTLTIQSATLPVGTPVTLEVTMDLWSNQLNAGANQGVTGWSICGFDKPNFLTIQTEGSVQQSQTGVCRGAVGDSLYFRTVLYGRSTAATGFGSSQVRSFDAVANFSVRVLTEGASFSSASGSLYLAQPVPEPASAALLLGGLAGLGWWRRRAGR